MNREEQIKMFVATAVWLEAEYVRAARRPQVCLRRLEEIHQRNNQNTREFLKFMETHPS